MNRQLLTLALAISLIPLPRQAAASTATVAVVPPQRPQMLVLTPEEFAVFKQQNPHLVKLELSPEEAQALFAQVSKTLPEEHAPQEEPADPFAPEPSSTPLPTETDEPAETAPNGYAPRPNFYFHLQGGISSNHDDLIVVLLAAAVVFAVVMALVYAGEFAVRNLQSQPKIWSNDRRLYFAGQGFRMQGAALKGQQEQGLLTGLGFVVQERHVNPSLGLQAEMGQITATFLLDQGAGSHHLQGAYGLIGPRLEYEIGQPREGKRFFTSLMGGTTTNSETGLMSLWQAGYGSSLPWNRRWAWQLQAGSLYLDLKSDFGLERYKNDFNLVGGFQVSRLF